MSDSILHSAFFGPMPDYSIDIDNCNGITIATHYVGLDIEEKMTPDEMKIFDIIVISRFCPQFGLVAKFIMSLWKIPVVWKDGNQIFVLPEKEERVKRVYLEAKIGGLVDALWSMMA